MLHVAEKLKTEAGKPADFNYPNTSYRRSKGATARLEAEAMQLEDQLISLDEENMKLRKALKTSAGSFAASGFKFAGMRPEDLVKVNEFAQNLRDGKLELPESDKTVEMARELRRLREDRTALQHKVEDLERGGAVATGHHPAVSSLPSTAGLPLLWTQQVNGLQEDVHKLLLENSGYVAHGQYAERGCGLDPQLPATPSSTLSYQRVMHANNETILNELKALRESIYHVNALVPAIRLAPFQLLVPPSLVTRASSPQSPAVVMSLTPAAAGGAIGKPPLSETPAVLPNGDSCRSPVHSRPWHAICYARREHCPSADDGPDYECSLHTA